jgi:4-amino-4-deoxy-L-arabinose transferase-like glycosyltransferase
MNYTRVIKQCLPLTLRQKVFWIIVVFYGLGAFLSQVRGFDQDEFQHLHNAWCIFKGWLPYRDFFEHHLPLYYFLVAPLFRFFNVETNVADAIASLFFMRKAMWLLASFILVLTFWLGKLWRNAEVGCVAVFFLLATEVYWSVTLEIRPDPLAVAFWLLYLVLFIRAVQPDQKEHIRKMIFGCSGLCLALAFLTSQKIVYAFPGLAICCCWYVFSPSAPETRRVRFGRLLYQLGGFCVPIIFTGFYFYLRGGFSNFLYYNFVFNAGLKRFSPYFGLHALAYQNPFLVLLSIAGLLQSILLIFQRSTGRRGDFILVPCTLALLVGLFVIPVPYAQYYLLFLPLVALFAAAFLLESVMRLIELRASLTPWQWISAVGFFCIPFIVFIVLLSREAGTHWPPLVVPAYWSFALLGCIALAFIKARTLSLVFLLVALSIPPMIRLHGAITSADTSPQIDEIRYGIENTKPTDTVMDGFTGTLVFRPHASFFWALPPNVQQRLGDKVKQDLLQDLQAERIAPKLILFDKCLQNLSPGIKGFFENHYEPVNIGVIWKRKAQNHE